MRFRYILQVKDRHKTLAKTNEIENNVLVLLWSHVELFLAILASSLVALRPLLRRAGEMIHEWRSKASTDHGESGSSDKSSDVNAPKGYYSPIGTPDQASLAPGKTGGASIGS